MPIEICNVMFASIIKILAFYQGVALKKLFQNESQNKKV